MGTHISFRSRPAAPVATPPSPMDVPVVQGDDVICTVEPRKMQTASNSHPHSSALSSTVSTVQSATHAPPDTTPGDPIGCPGGGSGPPTSQERRATAALPFATTQ